MVSLYTVGPTVNSGLIESADLNQLVNTLSGAQNTPVFIKNTDPISFTLQLQNTDSASKALLVTAADGSTVLARVQGSGMVASPDGTVADTIVTISHAQTLTNKTLSNPIINTGGLQVNGGNIGIGGAATGNNGLLIPGSYNINASGGAGAGLSVDPTLVAQATNDSLYGVYVQPAFNDNSHTGVLHYGLYVGSGQSYFANNVGLGFSPGTVQRLWIRGATADAGSDALLAQNSAGTNLLEVRDDGYLLFANGARNISPNGTVNSFYLTTTDGSNGIVQSSNGSLYVRSAGGANGVIMDTGTGGLNVSSGGPLNCAGYIAAGPAISAGAGDLNANRNNGTGYVFLANASHYIGFDGTSYQMPTSGLNVGGGITGTTLAAGASLIAQAGDISANRGNGTGVIYLGNNTHYLFFDGTNYQLPGSKLQVTGLNALLSQTNATDFKFDCGNAFMNNIPNGTQVVAIGFNAAFAAAPTSIVFSMNNISGGRGSYSQVHLGADGIGTNGFNLVIDNTSGGSQSFLVGWMAFGH
jgi:hypothetical protein